MALLNWENDFSVNVKEIDNQHKKIVNIINELYDAMLEGKSREVLSKTLSDLAEYTQYHFAFEEKYFEEFGYPKKEEHIKQHRNLVDKVLKFKSKYEEGAIFISIDIMEFLREWLKNHIAGSDKEYGPYFNSNGLI